MSAPTTASDLSVEDFKLFWGWLTYTKGCTLVAKKAETSKIVRIFSTLDMFNNNNEINAFIQSWRNESEYTVFSYELQAGLCSLPDEKFVKFYRFIMALQVKEREDENKRREKEYEREKNRMIAAEERDAKRMIKEEQSPISSPTASEKRPRDISDSQSRFKKASTVYPIENNDSNQGGCSCDVHGSTGDEGDDGHRSNSDAVEQTHKLDTIQSFKSKYQLPANTKKASPEPNLFGKFIHFLSRSFSSRTFDRRSSSSFSKRTESSVSGADNIVGKGQSQDSEDEGFSQRLTKANLSLFREEICGDDAMTAYRAFRDPSEIAESLQSFGKSSQDMSSAIDHGSRDQYSSFDIYERKSSIQLGEH